MRDNDFKKLMIIGLIVVMSLYKGYTQEVRNYDPFYVYENMPSSPEVSNLGEYGTVSASPYNGKADISIPLYAIDFEGIKIPIQLDYDSGGVQVASEASWVGLNWTITTIFNISRKIYGFDDFATGIGGEYSGAPLNGFIYNNIVPELKEGAGRPYHTNNDIVNVHHSYSIRDRVGGGTRYIDTQPDVYTANIFGNSYTFILKKKGNGTILNTQVFNNNNVKITFDLDSKSFTLIDDKGFIYEFSTKEVNTTFSSVTENTPPTSYQACINSMFAAYHRAEESLITNWSLDRVTSPRGRELNFKYERGTHFSFPNYTVEPSQLDAHHFNWKNEQFNSEIGKIDVYNVSTTVIENNYLTSIEGDFGKIKFNLAKRLDLSTGSTINTLSNNGFGNNFLVTSQSTIRSSHGSSKNGIFNDSTPYLPRKLDGIDVVDNSGDIACRINLHQSYYNNQSINDNVKERYLRLKLDSVSINNKKYSFDYINPNYLPEKDSRGVDFWGYSNGITENEILAPRINRFITSYLSADNSTTKLGQSFIKFSGADRSSNFDYGKNGLLHKVTYPTKGSAEFEYESHDVVLESPAPYEVTEKFSSVNRLRWTNMTDELKFGITYQYLKCAKDPDYNFYEEVKSDPEWAVTYEQNIGKVFTSEYPSILDVKGLIQVYTGWDGIGYWGNYPILIVEEINTGQEYKLFTYGDAPSSQGAPPTNVSKSVSLPPGSYRVVTRTAMIPSGDDYSDYPPIPAVRFYDSTILLNTYESINTTDFNDFYERFEIGGARVSKIIHKDFDGKFLKGIQYNYNYPNAISGLSSSGVLMDDLVFHSKTTGFYSYSPRFRKDFKLTSYNQVGGNLTAKGSHIGYSFVRELKIDRDGNHLGWVDREYHNEKNEYYKNSFCLPYSYDARKGDGDPYINILGIKTKWACSGLDFGNNCKGNSTSYSTLGDVCIQNTIVLGLPLRLSYKYANGNVMREKVYSENGSILQESTNNYKYLNGNLPPSYFSSFMNIGIGVETIDDKGSVVSTLTNTSEGPWGLNHHSYFAYKFPVHHGLVAKLSSRETINYLDKGNLYAESINSYNDYTHYLTKNKEIINELESTSKSYLYPYDDEVRDKLGMNHLRNDNMLSTIVKAVSYKNDVKLSSLEYIYGNTLKTEGKTLLMKILGYKSTQEPEQIMLYEKYDAKGNILQLKKAKGSIITSYLWGYNGQYLIAKIENASYEDIAKVLGTDVTTLKTYTEANLSTINTLRTKLPKAMVTTYTYEPLVGIRTMMDPKGYTTYYEYDNFNRLEFIKDETGKLLEQFKYHYKN